MGHVVAKDGTAIFYERRGSGPAVILMGGGLDDGSENTPLALELAEDFTVYNHARRGRGRSGDTAPYDVRREIEDLEALIAEAGGTAHVYGVSSGGMFALEAAAAGLPIDRLAVYEVPYDTAEDAPERVARYRERLAVLLSQDRRGDAVELFMELAGSSPQDIAQARSSPYWPRLESLAHTLAYDASCYGPPPVVRLASITRPTLVATGGEGSFFHPAADAIAAAVPGARRHVLTGQGHVAAPEAVAPVLRRFFTS